MLRLRSLRVLGWYDLGRIGTLTVLAVAFESFGVAMLVPILDFLQNDGDLAVLSKGSRLWQNIIFIYGGLGISVTLLTLSLAVLVLTTTRQIIAYINVIALTKLRWRIGRDMADRCFSAVMSSRADYIREFGTGTFIYLVNHQCQAANALVRSFATAWAIFVTFAAYGVLMLIVAPIASGFAIIVATAAIVSTSRYVRRSGELSRQTIKVGEGMSVFLAERYHAWRLIKLSDGVEREAARMREWTRQLYGLSVKMAQASARIELTVTPIMTVAVLAALLVSVQLFHVSVPVITLFVVILLRLMPVTRNFAALRLSITVQDANLARVMQVLIESRRDREKDPGTRPFKGLRQEIAFDSVSFEYPTGQGPALRSVSAVIPARKMTAITGPSGAGKSTLVDLIPRLIVPGAGGIRVDGTPIEDFTLRSLRRHIVLASQQPEIFNATVTENVRYLRPSASKKDVVRACGLAYADEFVANLPNGYDTVIGEGGNRLSGGERQRLILARAFLAKASILILDEPTSALDYESERNVQAALDNVVGEGKMTLIVIAHRLSTVRRADHLIVLKDGAVIEAGPPEKLRRDHKWFASMLALDAGETLGEEPVRTASRR